MVRIKIKCHYDQRISLRLLFILMAVLAMMTTAFILNHVRVVASASSTETTSPLSMRQYYLSKASVHSYEAPGVCASGYHFASLWEIMDPSGLKYNSTLGLTSYDSGEGPPTAYHGFTLCGPISMA